MQLVHLGALGILDFITGIISPILRRIYFPSELLPLALLRPISGNGSMAIATDILKNYGVDSKLGRMASTIMGSTETTLYIIALYTSSVKIKNTRFLLIAALFADFVGIVTSIVICRIL